MCGIIACILAAEGSEAAPELHQALYYLQHRGQDACGIATCSRRGKVFQCKGNGLASKGKSVGWTMNAALLLKPL
jgi:amidophosphoribosyltransferase